MISPLLLVEPLARGKARLDDRNRPQPDRPAPPPLKPEAQPPRRPIAGPKAGNATPSMAHCWGSWCPARPFDGPLLGLGRGALAGLGALEGLDAVGGDVAVGAVDGARANRERQRCTAVLAWRLAAGDVELAAAGLADHLLRARYRLQFIPAVTALLGLRVDDLHGGVLTVQPEEGQQALRVGLRDTRQP